MDKLAFVSAYKAKGWDRKSLAKRWGYISVRRIDQISLEVENKHIKAQAHIDRLNGLPDITNEL